MIQHSKDKEAYAKKKGAYLSSPPRGSTLIRQKMEKAKMTRKIARAILLPKLKFLTRGCTLKEILECPKLQGQDDICVIRTPGGALYRMDKKRFEAQENTYLKKITTTNL